MKNSTKLAYDQFKIQEWLEYIIIFKIKKYIKH